MKRLWPGLAIPMSDSLEPAYVLHRRNYSDTSLLVDFLTIRHGYVSCIAKGVKKSRHNTASLLQPFIPLLIRYTGKGSLKTLAQCESSDTALELKGECLYAAFYINELLLKFLYKYEISQGIFVYYAKALTDLSLQLCIDQTLRWFELNLIQHAGIGLGFYEDNDLSSHIDPEQSYLFQIDADELLPCDTDFYDKNSLVLSGDTLLALNQHKPLSDSQKHQAKHLTRMVINFYLDGYQFKSRELFRSIQKK